MHLSLRQSWTSGFAPRLRIGDVPGQCDFVRKSNDRHRRLANFRACDRDVSILSQLHGGLCWPPFCDSGRDFRPGKIESFGCVA